MMFNRRKALALMFYTGHQKSVSHWVTTRHITRRMFPQYPAIDTATHHLLTVDVATGIGELAISEVDPMDAARGYTAENATIFSDLVIEPVTLEREMRFDLMYAISSFRVAMIAAQVAAADQFIAGLTETQ
jgi:hypothetical protein